MKNNIKSDYEKQYKIWELRHNTCKKCHGEKNELCICGPEPCKNCGNTYESITETGCAQCSK